MGTGSSAMLKHTMKREKKLKMVKSHAKTALPSKNLSVEAAKMGARRAYPEPQMKASMKRIQNKVPKKKAKSKKYK